MTPHPHGYVVKLVRDGIPDLLGDTGTVTYGPIDRDAHVKLLRRKLIEEAAEYMSDPSKGELADILQVVYDLAVVDLEMPPQEVARAMTAKFEQRGGFDVGTVMLAVHPKYDRPS